MPDPLELAVINSISPGGLPGGTGSTGVTTTGVQELVLHSSSGITSGATPL